ncbi:MAG: hypothetical protein L0227_12870 [Chloroflexi bacterium]|nr:hypothetical protein [Chloroflexota bacterium]
MNRLVTTALALGLVVVAGCASTTTTPSPSGAITNPSLSPDPSSDASDHSRYFSIVEIGLGPDGYVTLINYTGAAASLAEVYVCQANGCVDLPNTIIEPGQLARIAVGDGEGLASVVVRDADLDLSPEDGEVAVFRSEDVTDSAGIRSYLQWGSTPHEMTDTAVEAGLWIATAYAPTAAHATRLWKTEANLWVWDPGQ